MRVIVWLILIGSCPCFASAQGQENVWVFGTNAGVDFNGGTPIPFQTAMTGYGEAAASVCDASGQLLFYTEGSNVWTRNGTLMPSGIDITGLPYILGLVTPTSSGTQGAVIVPVPDTLNKYYLFSLSSQVSEMGADFGKLYYSVVNMNLNGGLGDIEPGRKGILIDSGLTEKMLAIVGDRCNIWLVVHQENASIFKSYEITSAGISATPVISNVGSGSPFVYSVGALKVSSDRKRIVSCNLHTILFAGIGSTELFDFDPVTGILSNAVSINSQGTYNACFSPDDSKLYTSVFGGTGGIYQYDLTQPGSTAIQNSKTFLAAYQFTDLKLAPDGRIYLAPAPPVTNGTALSVIRFPDLTGSACQLTPNVVPLVSGTSFYAGLPADYPFFVHDTAAFTARGITVCFRDSTQLLADTAGKGWDYVWDGGETGRIITVDSSGTYIVHYHTPPCVYHTDTFYVSFASPVPLAAAWPGCKGAGNSFVYVVPGPGDTNTYQYDWKDSLGVLLQTGTAASGDTLFEEVPGIYYVTMSAANGCDTTLMVRLDLPDYAASFIADTVICIGDTIDFINTSHGFTSYLWNYGDGDTSALQDPSHIYAFPGTYTVVLTGNPCRDSAIAHVRVDSMSYISFKMEDRSFCAGTSILFYPAYPPGADTLVWDFGDNTISDDGLLQPSHAYDSAGRWVVKLNALFRACPDAAFMDTVDVYPYPLVDLGPDTSICVNGTALLVYNQHNPPPGDRFIWNTGDTLSAITGRHPGIYALTVTTAHGCSSTDSMEVFKDCYLDIPNAFTPDGDGVNDYFLPRELLGRRLVKFSMLLFNRWGQIIFQTDKIDGSGWDGRFNGRDQPQGVYIYLIDAELDGNIRERYKGNVTLIR